MGRKPRGKSPYSNSMRSINKNLIQDFQILNQKVELNHKLIEELKEEISEMRKS